MSKTRPNFRGFGAWAWLFQMVSAVLLFVLIFVHMVSTHTAPNQQTYQAVVGTLKDPWWLAFEVVFLALLVFHSFNGVRAIVYDLVSGRRLRQAVSGILAISGAILFAFGTWVLFVVSGVI